MGLDYYYDNTNYDYEICIDEVGRGCMFGDAVVSSVILPKTQSDSFDTSKIKDSKKFTNKQKLYIECDNITKNVFFHHTARLSNTIIDDINILQAVMKGMHECALHCVEYIQSYEKDNFDPNKILLVIDGNYFIPFEYDGLKIEDVTVKQGDGKYIGIAAASIIAKTTRDQDIIQLCKRYPILNDRYNLEKNVGYGSKAHLDGIKQYGITQWHRKTFGSCKGKSVSNIE